MPKGRLTQRQTEAYEFIRRFIREERKPPTLQEIGDALGIASTNGVYKLLQALQAKGYVEREKHAARGLTLLDEDGPDPFAPGGGVPSLPLVVDADSTRPDRLRERPRRFLSVDDRLLGRSNPDDCLVLRAGDDGMNGDGIHRGDLLVVEEQELGTLRNGTLVAAVVGEQIQARQFHLANGRIHLRPADRHYTEETFLPDDPGCNVVGPILTLLRPLS